MAPSEMDSCTTNAAGRSTLAATRPYWRRGLVAPADVESKNDPVLRSVRQASGYVPSVPVVGFSPVNRSSGFPIGLLVFRFLKVDTMPIEREQLEADVLIIGAGPSGLACALQLANLIEQHNKAKKSPELSTENVYVLEKAREIGAHQLSGAILDPCALRELVPDFENPAPLDPPVPGEAVYFLTERNSWNLPIAPPPFRNHGNYVISLNKLVTWLSQLVEQKGVSLFAGFSGRELIYENNGIDGVVPGDQGVDRNGKPKGNFRPGYELRAKVTVLAEGPRGSLTKDLVTRLNLEGLNPQAYGIGIKELWEVQPGRVEAGFVAHTL